MERISPPLKQDHLLLDLIFPKLAHRGLLFSIAGSHVSVNITSLLPELSKIVMRLGFYFTCTKLCCFGHGCWEKWLDACVRGKGLYHP